MILGNAHDHTDTGLGNIPARVQEPTGADTPASRPCGYRAEHFMGQTLHQGKLLYQGGSRPSQQPGAGIHPASTALWAPQPAHQRCPG